MPETPREWIEHNRQLRVTEGVSIAEQEMLKALAEQVVADKLSRALMGPGNDKGRCSFIMEGEPSEAEQHWSKLVSGRMA